MATDKKRQMKERICQSIVETLHAIMPSAAKVESPEFHQEIDERMRNLDREKVNAVAPRGHAKSTVIAVAMVIWHIFLEPIYRELEGLFVRHDDGNKHRPYEPAYVLIISKTQKDAKKRLREIKYILGDEDANEQSKQFKALFGEWGEKTARKWRSDQIELKDGTVIQAIGTGQNVHGLKEGDSRPTLIIVDDPENEENTKTAEAKARNMRWLFQGIVPARDPQIGRVCVIGTPIDTSCMVVNLHQSWRSADMADNDSIWFQNDKEREISRWSVSEESTLDVGEDEFIEEDTHGRWLVKPDVLWPEWFPVEKLESEYTDIKSTDNISTGVYYRMYECKVVGDSDQIFHPHFFDFTFVASLLRDGRGKAYLKIHAIHGDKIDKTEERAVAVTTGIDPAYSTSRRSDHTAIANVATDADDRIYELEGVYRKIDPTMLLHVIESNDREFMPMRTMMEANGPQKFVYEKVQQETDVAVLADQSANQQAKKGEGGRIHQLQPHMKPDMSDEGDVLKAPDFHHRRESPLKTELLNYPRGNDDYADAMEKAVRIRIRPSHEIEKHGDVELTSSARPMQDPMLS